jgi:hypothetical protein
MSSVYAGITVLVVILELTAFMSLFWKSVDKEPYRRWPRLQAPLRMLPGMRESSTSRVRLDPVDARPAWAHNHGGKTPLAALPPRQPVLADAVGGEGRASPTPLPAA